jgi:ankyrin repeat protein
MNMMTRTCRQPVRNNLLAALVTGLLLVQPGLAATPLLDSIHNGRFETALQLAQSGEGINIPESNGTTALHYAVHYGDLALVNALIDAGAEVNVMNNYGSSPVSEAAVLGDYAIMKALLDAGADPESANADNQTALMIVARSNNVATARLLLEHGADVHATEQWQGQNAVIWAAAQSQPEMLQLLIDAGGDPDSRSKPNERDRQVSAERRFQWRPAGGITALGYAAREGCLACAQILVAAGADLDKGDAENVTPLLLAVQNLRFDTARYLVEAGANVNKWSLRGENPIYSAVDVNTLPHGGYPDRPSMDATSSLQMIEILLDAGANPNLQLKLQPTYRHIKDDRGADGMLSIGATPLLRAAKGHDVDAVRLLLAHGALPNLPNRNGTTPVMAAAGLGASSIDTRGDYATPLAGRNARATLEVLLDGGGDLALTDRAGRTALHGAAAWGWNEAVQYLAEQGADITAADNNGMTPLDFAMGRVSASGRGGGGEARPETAALLQTLMLDP